MKVIFRNPDLQARFEEDGYLTMPFLPEQAVADLRQLFGELHPENPEQGFYSSTYSTNDEAKARIFARVDQWYTDLVAETFSGVKKLGASFLLKQPGQTGHMPIHQDWTVTDEAGGDFTLTIWVPLEDVGPENGAIRVLPGSHRFSNALRGPSLPVIWREVDDLLETQLRTLTMKAGEAFIFDHSLLHSSHLNQSDRPRLAVTYGLAPQEAELVYYWREGERIERLHMGDELFMRYANIGQRPDFGVHQGYFRQDLHPVSREECQALLSGKLAGVDRPLERLPGSLTQAAPVPQLSILKDAGLNQQLHEQGYVTFPLLDAGAVERLKNHFAEHHPRDPEGFYATAHASDTNFRRKMSDLVREVLAPFLRDCLDEAEALGGTFIAKSGGNRGMLPPHADWNIVDEAHSRSFNLWIPLVDTVPENGAVCVLPYSHDWLDSFRGPGIPNPFEGVAEKLWQVMQPLPMQAGEALLYDHRLLHASPVNQTGALRLACVCGVVPAGEAMRHYRQESGLLVEYASNVDFFLSGNPENGPGDLPRLGVKPYSWPVVGEAELDAFLRTRLPELVSDPEPDPVPAQYSFWEVYTPANIWRELRHRFRKATGQNPD